MRWPSVSVFIPALNAEATIGATLDTIRGQEYDGAVEIVVAEGGSTDGTRVLLEAQPDVLIVDNPSGKTPSGLNAAIAAASGEVLVRCDAHAQLPPGYLRRGVEVLAETGADVVGGRQDAVAETPLTEAIAAAHNSWIAGGARFRTATAPGPAETVYLGIFRRETFETYGLFDETMLRNQDFELNHRVRSQGGLVYFHPDLSVRYKPRSSLRSLWKQYWSYGAGKRRMLAKHPRSLRLRQLLPLGLVLGFMTTGALTPWSLFPLVALATAYGLVLVASAAAGHSWTARLRLPAVTATMHLAWGLGFLFGRNKERD